MLGTGFDVKDSKEKKYGDQTVNYLLECDNFEKLLQERDDYIDFADVNQEITPKNVRISSIIRAVGEIYVPEEFDLVQLIHEYKSYFLKEMEYENYDEQELVKNVFNNAKIKIPIFCELGKNCGYWMGVGKVSQDDLLIGYNELEDYEGKEVTILAKLESRRYYKDKPLVVFDIYKDFLGFNRSMRKQIASDPKEEFEYINVTEDYLGLEILAIY